MKTLNRSLLTAVLAVGLAATASAQTWSGAHPSDGRWTINVDWVGGMAPVSANTTDITFGNSLGNLPSSSIGLAARTIRTLNYLNTDTDTTIRLATTDANTTLAVLTFDTDTVGGNSSINVDAASAANITIGVLNTVGSITLADNLVVNHAGTGNLTIGRAIGGAFSVTKTGAGTLVMAAGASTFSGGLKINEGQVTANNNTTTATSSDIGNGTVTLAGGTLAFVKSAAVTYSSANFTTTASTTSTVTYNETGAADATLTIATGKNTTLNGDLLIKNTSSSGGADIINWGQAMSGAGKVSFEGNNNFASNYTDRRINFANELNNPNWTGIVESRKGSVTFSMLNAFTTGALQIGVTAGADVAGIGFVNGNPGTSFGGTLNNAITVRSGAGQRVLFTGLGNTTPQNVTWAGTIALEGTLTYDSSSTSGAVDTLSGVISGVGGIIKKGNNQLTLSNTNTYTGDTNVTAGTLLLADTGALKFMLGNNTSNKVTGAGSATFDGRFNLDLSLASGTAWTLVDVTTKSYTGFNGLFDLGGIQTFAKSGSDWVSAGYSFSETSGILTAIPEPATWALLAFSLTTVMVLRRRRQSQDS